MNGVTSLWSNIGATAFIIGACVVAVAFLWWRTRQWRRAFVPAIAISVQSTVLVTPGPSWDASDPASRSSTTRHRRPASRAGTWVPRPRST